MYKTIYKTTNDLKASRDRNKKGLLGVKKGRCYLWKHFV